MRSSRLNSISIVLTVSCLIAGASFSQGQVPFDNGGGPINVINPGTENQVIDGVFMPTHVPTKRPIAYETIREADYIWSKRVFRRIDLREKMNFSLKYPFDDVRDSATWVRNTTRWSLWTIVRQHIMWGDVTIFEPENPNAWGMFDGDQFKYPVASKINGWYETDPEMRKNINIRYFGKMGPTTDPIKSKDPIKMENDEDSTIYDPIKDEYVVQFYPGEMQWVDGNDIQGYDLKEDWFFDKERSVLDVRIIGIAPVVNWKDDSRTSVVFYNNQTGQPDEANSSKWVKAPLFWLYFPQLRPYLAKYYVYNEDNDAQWMSFDDFFWKRRFSSYIVKESNVFDRTVEQYKYGLDALIESEAITEEIRTLEHDMWNF
jgi:gliding motility associated protien GldN